MKETNGLSKIDLIDVIICKWERALFYKFFDVEYIKRVKQICL